MGDGVFINYRRSDSRHAASRIYDSVRTRLGRDRVFMDVDSIGAGAAFPEVLSDALARSGVFLALIGENWLDARDQSGNRRLDDPADFVRREIAEAIRAPITVIPVLLDDARLPQFGELPDDIRPLVTRNLVRVRHETFSNDVATLIDAVRDAMRPSPEVVRLRRQRTLKLAIAALSGVVAAGLAWWFDPVVVVRNFQADRQQAEADRRQVSDRAAWSAAEHQNTIQSYTTYLELHREGERRSEAERRLQALSARAADERQQAEANSRQQEIARLAREEEQRRARAAEEIRQQQTREDNEAFEAAKRLDQPGAYRLYLEQKPHGVHRDRASSRLAELEREESTRVETEAWSRALLLNRLVEFRYYLRLHPDGMQSEAAKREIDRRESIARRWNEQREMRAPSSLRALLNEARDTEFAATIGERLESLEVADKAAWTEAHTAQLRSAYAAYLKSWPLGDYRDEARARLDSIAKAEQEWRRIKGRNDEVALEAFLRRDDVADFAHEALSELVALKRSRQKPLPPDVTILKASEVLALLDGRKLRLGDAGQSITFSRGIKPPDRLKIRPNYLQFATNVRFIAEGGFKADGDVAGQRLAISGIGGVQESQVDSVGSLYLIQILATDRTERDLGAVDRLYLTMQMIKTDKGYVCVGTQWSYFATDKPAVFEMRCDLE